MWPDFFDLLVSWFSIEILYNLISSVCLKSKLLPTIYVRSFIELSIAYFLIKFKILVVGFIGLLIGQ